VYTSTQIKLSDHEFKLISNLIFERFGIVLTEKKKSLIVSRLHKLLIKDGFSTFKDYYNYIVTDKSGKALSLLIDKLSTNYTYFFREKDHFEYLSHQVFPELKIKLEQKQISTIRLWSAGCSSGEEPYTLSMLLDQYFSNQLDSIDAGILATDISSHVLQISNAGIYGIERIKPLPENLKKKYLIKIGKENWQFNERVKRLLLFKRLNLMRSEYPFKGKFDVIFCRNVMIYFDSKTRDEIVQRFSRYLNPGGYLFIGHSETLGRSNPHFRYIQPAVYRKFDD